MTPLAPLHPRPTSPLPRAVSQLSPEETNYKHDKRVAHYWLGRKLGEGAFAKVKEGLHRPTGEKVALKIIDKKKAKADKYVSRNMRREAKLMTMICHPNVLRLLDEVETENSYYLVTEIAEGGDLMDHIYKHNHLPEDEVRRYISQIVSAVDHIHKAGIIHRDLKIENLLLDADHNIKIIDFGLSNTIRPLSPSRPIENHCKTQCGSPAYAAPELLGREEYGIEVDIWSIGVNLFAMLTGMLPFTVDPFNITELHAKMLSRRMNPIPDHLHVSAECQDLLRRLLNPSRARRIKMPEIFAHSWLNNDATKPFEPIPFPNRPTVDDIDDKLMNHMTSRLQFSAVKVTNAVVNNKACAALATYYLLAKRIARYHKQHPEALRKKRGLTRQTSRRRSMLLEEGNADVPIINEDELLETVHLPPGFPNGLPGLKREERQSSSSQRSGPFSSEELSPGSENQSAIASPIGPTPRGPFSPMSLSDEEEQPAPIRRTESFSVKARPQEPRTLRKVVSTPTKTTQTPARSRLCSMNSSSLASPGSPCTPEGNTGHGAPTPKALKQGVEQAFGASRDKERSGLTTWLPPTIDTGGRHMTTASGRQHSIGRLQELPTQTAPLRRSVQSSFGKAVNDVRSSQASSRTRRADSRQEELSPPGRVIKTNTFFQEAVPEPIPVPLFEGKGRGSRRNSIVEELGGAQQQSLLPALNPRGSISAGKRPMSKSRSSNASTSSRPHTTGTTPAQSLRPAAQNGGVGAKYFTIDSLGGVSKPHIVHQLVTTLNGFRDIENVVMNGMSIRCVCYDVSLEISVPDDAEDTCSIKFERIGSGGNRLRYNEICDQIVRALGVVA